MKDIIDLIYQDLEKDDDLWLELEHTPDYKKANDELQLLNDQIKEILEEKLGREGFTLLNDQESLYYRLITLSQKYFFKVGYKMALEKDSSK